MKIKIFLSFLCVFLLINATFAGGNPFDLPKLKLKSNADQRLWIGDNWVKDSTNYFVFNQGGFFWDSLRIRRDLYVGELGGTIYLDTNGENKVYASGYGLYLENVKSSGTIVIQAPAQITLSATDVGGEITFTYGGLGGNTIGYMSSTGLTISYGNIQLLGGTQQIKVPSDTASDYDSNDDITLNVQSGVLTTKALTTAALGNYTLTLTNSLIVATSKVFAIVRTNTSGIPVISQCAPTTGSCSIIMFNLHASVALSSAITISFIVWN